jgi:phage gpG-like protein
MREPLKRSIQQVLAPSFKKNFDVGGRPNPWEPLADYTVEVRGSATPILERSRLLKRTIQQLNIWTIDREKAALLDLPSKIWYGKLQQAGRDDQNLPARPFVMIQDDDYDKIERVFQVWLAERIALSRAFRVGGQGR